jgi:hypothetical protein
MASVHRLMMAAAIAALLPLLAACGSDDGSGKGSRSTQPRVTKSISTKALVTKLREAGLRTLTVRSNDALGSDLVSAEEDPALGALRLKSRVQARGFYKRSRAAYRPAPGFDPRFELICNVVITTTGPDAHFDKAVALLRETCPD